MPLAVEGSPSSTAETAKHAERCEPGRTRGAEALVREFGVNPRLVPCGAAAGCRIRLSGIRSRMLRRGSAPCRPALLEGKDPLLPIQKVYPAAFADPPDRDRVMSSFYPDCSPQSNPAAAVAPMPASSYAGACGSCGSRITTVRATMSNARWRLAVKGMNRASTTSTSK